VLPYYRCLAGFGGLLQQVAAVQVDFALKGHGFSRAVKRWKGSGL